MAKHIAPPATVEELVQTLGITREDREIVERVLRELGEYDGGSIGTDAGGNPLPDDGPPPPLYKAPKKDE
jgi:hypothetical protein